MKKLLHPAIHFCSLNGINLLSWNLIAKGWKKQPFEKPNTGPVLTYVKHGIWRDLNPVCVLQLCQLISIKGSLTWKSVWKGRKESNIGQIGKMGWNAVSTMVKTKCHKQLWRWNGPSDLFHIVVRKSSLYTLNQPVTGCRLPWERDVTLGEAAPPTKVNFQRRMTTEGSQQLG